MTIDAFDWLHRTGARPGRRADRRPVQGAAPRGPGCTRASCPAYEYQHLLQHYTDPNEVNFVNEGLSDFAGISLVGYGHPARRR